MDETIKILKYKLAEIRASKVEMMDANDGIKQGKRYMFNELNELGYCIKRTIEFLKSCNGQ